MKTLLCLAIAAFAASLVLAACGGPDATSTPVPEPVAPQSTTPAGDGDATDDEDGAAMEDKDGAAMEDKDDAAMEDKDDAAMEDEDGDAKKDEDGDAKKDEDGDAMEHEDSDATEHEDSDATDDDDSDAMKDKDGALPEECLPGGVLDDVATISSCSIEASQQVEGFSFDATFNLLAVFPIEGVEEEAMAAMELSGRVSPPDRFEFMISLGPEGEMIEIRGVAIGTDAYMQDPESGQWFKGTPPDSDFLSVVPLVGTLLPPDDVGATLSETVDLADGGKAYVLLYDQPGPGDRNGRTRLPGRRANQGCGRR